MKWTATPFEGNDLPKVGLFFKNQFPGPGTYGSQSLFQWKIVDNYYMEGVLNLVKDDATIASTTSVTPKKLLVNQKELKAAEIGDTYTDSNYRRQGMFALLINKTREDAESKGIGFVYGTPNSQSLPGYEKKANFKLIPSAEVATYLLPLNIGYKLKNTPLKYFSNLLGAFSSVFLFTFYKIKSVLNGNSGFQAEKINELPENWDELWENSKNNYDFIFSRSKESINWRFFQNPNKYSFYLLKENGNPVGYIVTRYLLDEEGDSLVIADFLTIPGKEKALNTGFDHIVQEAYLNNVNFITTWCPNKGPFAESFEKFGFLNRSKVNIICYQNSTAEEINQCKNWHFTMSDSDNI